MGPVYASGNPQLLLAEIGERKGRAAYFQDIDFSGYENGVELATKIRIFDPRGIGNGSFPLLPGGDGHIVKGDAAVLRKHLQFCLKSIDQRMQDESGEKEYYYSLKIIDFYASLQKLQEELGERFWRCHRGCLVPV